MTVITFDTLKYSKTLIEAGVPSQQAEAQAEALAAVIEEQISTKQDLKLLEARLETKILTKLGSLMLICTAILGILISLHH